MLSAIFIGLGIFGTFLFGIVLTFCNVFRILG